MGQSNFYNQNQNRCFPFLKGSCGVETPDAGAVTMAQLPHDFIVDAGFTPGTASYYDTDTDIVYLRRVYRIGSTIFFEFATTAPELDGSYMVFSRDVTDPDYEVEFLEIGSHGQLFISQSESGDVFCDEPLWSGYLVTGSMASIASRLASGESIIRSDDEVIIETALIQNLHSTILAAIDLANADRTRVMAPEGCDDPVWPYETGVIFPGERCIQGDPKLKGGFNCLIEQDDANNRLVIKAAEGRGEGYPCEETTLFDDESPPVGSPNNLLSGGLQCNEVLRSINGMGGPFFNILAGLGVSIVPEPDLHKVKVDVNMFGLSVCFTSEFSQFSASL